LELVLALVSAMLLPLQLLILPLLMLLLLLPLVPTRLAEGLPV
jgi:hypothetical protein